MDGFEAGLGSTRWNTYAPSIGTEYGRLGGTGIRVGDQFGQLVTKVITITDSTIAYGFAVNLAVGLTNNDQIVQNLFGSGTHMVWKSTNNLEIQNVPDDSSDFTSTSNLFTPSVWHWIEAEVEWSDTVGTVKAWIDGVIVIDESGLNTITQPSTVTVTWGGGGGVPNQMYLDDVAVTDGAGSYNNTRPIGDSEVVALYPDGNGNTSGLTGSDADQVDNYLLVNEFLEPDTADYVESATQGDLDTYTFDNLNDSAATILGIQLENYTQKSDSGGKSGRGIIRTNSVDYPQTTLALPTSWALDIAIIEENPDTTNAWTGTEVDSLEAGFEVRNT